MFDFALLEEEEEFLPREKRKMYAHIHTRDNVKKELSYKQT